MRTFNEAQERRLRDLGVALDAITASLASLGVSAAYLEPHGGLRDELTDIRTAWETLRRTQHDLHDKWIGLGRAKDDADRA